MSTPRRAIIMAAGTSQRLRPLTADIPKTLLKLGEKSILEHILDAARENGIEHFDLVTGHGHPAVEEAALQYQKKFPAVNINLIYNDAYSTAGNIVSMRVAEEVFDEDFLLINSDTIFHGDILKRLIESDHANAMVIDDVKELGEEEMKVRLDENETITHIHKSLDPKDAHGEYIGVMKLSKSAKQYVLKGLDDTIADDETLYYEDALARAIEDHGLVIHPISTAGLPAMEIDTHEDLAAAKELIKKMSE